MSKETSSDAISAFGALGMVIAVNISWSMNHAIGWAILHGILGWIYVIYRGIFAGYTW